MAGYCYKYKHQLTSLHLGIKTFVSLHVHYSLVISDITVLGNLMGKKSFTYLLFA